MGLLATVGAEEQDAKRTVLLSWIQIWVMILGIIMPIISAGGWGLFQLYTQQEIRRVQVDIMNREQAQARGAQEQFQRTVTDKLEKIGNRLVRVETKLEGK